MPRLLTYHELREHGVLYTRRHIDRLEALGKFPRRVPIGERRVGWVEKEIDDHVRAAIGSRSTMIGQLGSCDKTKRRERPALR